MATTDSKKKSKYEMTINREDVPEKSSFEEIGKEDSFIVDPIQGIFYLCSTHDEKLPFHMSRISHKEMEEYSESEFDYRELSHL